MNAGAGEQQALTLDDVLKDKDGIAFLAERIAVFLPEHWDVRLFIGHITEAEANRRLAALDQTLSGLLTVRGDFAHRWGVFERHYENCESLQDEAWIAANGDAGVLCHCDQPWYVRWVEAGTAGAVAVTTAYTDYHWGAA